jgi:IclR family pca regulon transcriptional regulator
MAFLPLTLSTVFDNRTYVIFANTLISSKWAVKPGVNMAEAQSERKPEGMAGLAKGLAIIEAFSVRSTMSVADAARAAGTTRATARRCLLTLVELGYIELSGRDFRPLDRLRKLGGASSEQERLMRVAQPLLERARDVLAESVSLAVLDDDQSLFIARAEAEHIVSTGVRVGARLPLYCSATGRVLLGGRSDREIRERLGRRPIVARTPHALSTIADVLSAIRAATECGYAISDEELALGLRSMAVPVSGVGGEVLAALSVSAASARVKVSDLRRRFLPVLSTCASQIYEAFALVR